ncbi:hypothetical protein C2E21_5166 [Chlorella sorokiniana]|uniref:Uncharacterized protein n=1 Tax=Chlorella sorokiniana TaxID=3076 RepID=A0A2P6TQG9_CHLSO|nr:hypothetical protein C2E21_5166 [Chlorella sorokiniana]|eukprot:PRW56277.1 hypothetical protein C2E21_5166 [Chlorella sorokiniana]
MAQRRPGSPSAGRGGGLDLRRALVILAALPMCIAFYRLCSAGGMGGSAGAARGGGLPRRRLGGDVLEVPRPLEERVRVAASLAADSAAEHGGDADQADQEAEPAEPARVAEQHPAEQQQQPAEQHAGTVLPSTSTAVVSGAASVHGFVHKAGPLSPKLWQPQYREWRRERRQAWLQERHEQLAAGKPAPSLPLTQECQVWVNHRYRIIYLRHAKTGSSSLFCYFNGCRDNKGQAETAFVPLTNVPEDEVEDLWRSYFVVSFVRNAYTRAVSSYRMMMRNVASQSYGWDQFCADPASFVDECMADPACSKKGADFVYTHIQPQAECIKADDGGWAVDFIGRMEHIDQDLSLVLEQLDQRRPKGVPPVKPLERSLENVNGRGCNETASAGHHAAREQYCDPEDYFRGQHSACLAAVAQQYQDDVSALRFEVQQAPEVFDVIDAAEHTITGSHAAEQLQKEQQALELAGEAGEHGEAAAEARRLLR